MENRKRRLNSRFPPQQRMPFSIFCRDHSYFLSIFPAQTAAAVLIRNVVIRFSRLKLSAVYGVSPAGTCFSVLVMTKPSSALLLRLLPYADDTLTSFTQQASFQAVFGPVSCFA